LLPEQLLIMSNNIWCSTSFHL